jgi:OOP family OmpA-OmpF porin
MIRKPLFLFAALACLAAPLPLLADTNDHAVVQDNRGNVVHNTTGNCVRTQWESAGDPCAPAEPPPPPKPVVVETPPPPPPPAPPVRHTVISEAARTVYFPFNKTGLTTDAKQQLDTLAETLKSAKDIQEARVVGAADRIGSNHYNDKLSEKRAEAVRDYLIARGYTNASVTKTRWVGKSEPVTQCSKKLPHKKLVACLQGDRRVHIEIVYKSEIVTPAKTTSTPASVPPPIPPMPVR